jgi:hypothetical protein
MMSTAKFVADKIKIVGEKCKNFKESGCNGAQQVMLQILTGSGEAVNKFDRKVLAAEIQSGSDTGIFQLFSAVEELSHNRCIAIALSDLSTSKNTFEHRWIIMKEQQDIYCFHAFRREDMRISIAPQGEIIDINGHLEAIFNFVNFHENELLAKYKRILSTGGFHHSFDNLSVVKGKPVVTVELFNCAISSDVMKCMMQFENDFCN